jgi:hypothetical protein
VRRLVSSNPAHPEGGQIMRKFSREMLIVASFAVLASWSPARNETMAQPATSLTALDYIEIQQLVNKLNFALDYCTNGGQDFADLFIEGGTFTIDNGGGDARTMSTRERLIALAGGPDCESRKTPPSAYILHLAESLVIERTPDGARGKSYAIYPSRMGKFFSEDIRGQLGVYHDEYVRTAGGWRMKSRRHETAPVVGESDL